MPEKKRHKLIDDNSRPDYYLGLVSAEADYKVSLIINDNLNLKLRSNDPVSLSAGTRLINYPRFSSRQRYSEIEYDLISNRNAKDVLMPRIPSIDFILRIRGLHKEEELYSISNKLRELKEITGVFRLDRQSQLEESILNRIP